HSSVTVVYSSSLHDALPICYLITKQTIGGKLMKQQKSLLWLISIFILSMILAGCGGDASGNSDSSGDGDKKVVGIAMPTKSSERRVEDGKNMVEQLEYLGYETELQYAENVVENQI